MTRPFVKARSGRLLSTGRLEVLRRHEARAHHSRKVLTNDRSSTYGLPGMR